LNKKDKVAEKLLKKYLEEVADNNKKNSGA